MYDVFILCLMLSGILAVVVYSYKIFRSYVYPVGMVRRTPAIQECEDATTSILPDFETPFEQDEFIKAVIVEGFSDKELDRDLNLSEADIKDYLQRDTKKVYAKRRLRAHSGWRQYRLVLRHNLEQNPSREEKDSTLEEEIVEHGEALKIHSKQFEEIEKRIRRLEIESVQKLQEATEEKPRPPQVVQ